MSYLSHSGANVPRHFSSRKRMYQGAKVLSMALSLSGAKVRANESSSYPFQPPSSSQLLKKIAALVPVLCRNLPLCRIVSNIIQVCHSPMGNFFNQNSEI